ncbi:MAG: FHA domain-containing protein, partial [Proteobacteria bacterium]|nr:FHA domain-containing protein [Pseudomonadota bacterium]
MDEFLVFVTLPGTDERSSGRFSGTVLVGRSDECDVRLPHALVSRRHAQLSRTDDGAVVIRDLGSSNGTIAEDTVLRDAELVVQQTATLHIGPYSIVVSTDVASDDKTLLEQPRDPGAGLAMRDSDATAGEAGPAAPREPSGY